MSVPRANRAWHLLHVDAFLVGMVAAATFWFGDDPSPFWAASVAVVAVLAPFSWLVGRDRLDRRAPALAALALPFAWTTLNGVLVGLTPLVSMEPDTAADGAWPWIVLVLSLLNAIAVAALGKFSVGR